MAVVSTPMPMTGDATAGMRWFANNAAPESYLLVDDWSIGRWASPVLQDAGRAAPSACP